MTSSVDSGGTTTFATSDDLFVALRVPEIRGVLLQACADSDVRSDALRALHPEDPMYTFWSYKRDRWRRNAGLRLDHLLLSPEAATRLSSASVEQHVRAWEKPSDHVPVTVTLDV